MKNHRSEIIKLLVPLLIVLFAGKAFAQADASDESKIRQVIMTMNLAITERDNQRLLSTFADNSIRYKFYPAHGYGNKSAPSTAVNKVVDLVDSWESVTSILYKATRTYERHVTDMAVHTDKGMAMVWATITTRSQSIKENAKVINDQFSEVYLLRFSEGSWRIAAATNNRNYIK